jgi:hypothetical protein
MDLGGIHRKTALRDTVLSEMARLRPFRHCYKSPFSDGSGWDLSETCIAMNQRFSDGSGWDPSENVLPKPGFIGKRFAQTGIHRKMLFSSRDSSENAFLKTEFNDAFIKIPASGTYHRRPYRVEQVLGHD